MNSSIIEGKWDEFKGKVRKTWGRLTENEIEETKGDLTAIKGLLEQKYGQRKEAFEDQLNGIYDQFKDKKEEAVDAVKDNLKNY